MSYRDYVAQAKRSIDAGHGTWDGVGAEAVARMRIQNRFKTGLDIAKYTAGIMRRDMAAYDADSAKYTQSLGVWHGFIRHSWRSKSTSAALSADTSICPDG